MIESGKESGKESVKDFNTVVDAASNFLKSIFPIIDKNTTKDKSKK